MMRIHQAPVGFLVSASCAWLVATISTRICDMAAVIALTAGLLSAMWQGPLADAQLADCCLAAVGCLTLSQMCGRSEKNLSGTQTVASGKAVSTPGRDACTCISALES